MIWRLGAAANFFSTAPCNLPLPRMGDKTHIYVILAVVLAVVVMIGFFVFRGQETSQERMRAQMTGDQQLTASLAKSNAQANQFKDTNVQTIGMDGMRLIAS